MICHVSLIHIMTEMGPFIHFGWFKYYPDDKFYWRY